MINCAHHGKCLVDALAGRDKYDLKIGYIEGIDSAKRDEFNKKILECVKARRHLEEREKQRQEAEQGESDKHDLVDSKHPKGERKHTKKKDPLTHVSSRQYDCTLYATEEDIPFRDCTYRVKSGFDKGKSKTPKGRKNGLHEMFHFRCHPLIPVDTCAVRRILCLCASCKDTLEKEWDPKEKDPSKQDCFQKPEECFFNPIMDDLNKWHFIEIEPSKGKEDQRQVNRIVQSAMDNVSRCQAQQVVVGGFGAIDSSEDDRDAPDGFYLVKWTREPFVLQEDTPVECYDEGNLKAGSTVVEGIYWDRVGHAPGWYEPPENTPRERPKKCLFWIQHVMKGEVIMDN